MGRSHPWSRPLHLCAETILDQKELAERRWGVLMGGGTTYLLLLSLFVWDCHKGHNFYFIFLRKLHLNFSNKEGSSPSPWSEKNSLNTSPFLCLYGFSLQTCWSGIALVLWTYRRWCLTIEWPCAPHLADPTPECSLLPKPRAMVMTWARCYKQN